MTPRTPRELEKNALLRLQEVFSDEREQVLINESSYMLCKAMQVSRAKLFTSRDTDLEQAVITDFTNYLERRLKKEPLAYILEEQEFFSLNFKVSKDVLIPRPETELLVQEALKVAKQYSYLVDIGSGSGAIVVSIAKHSKDLKCYALDISPAACRITTENAQKNGVTVEVLESDLLAALPEISEPVLFVSNPPYIPENEALMADVQDYEPKLALRGGADGLSIIKRILREFSSQVLKNSKSILLMEIGIGQLLDVKSAAQELNLDVLDAYQDFQSIPRIIRVGQV